MDYFAVFFDTYNDQQNGFQFLVTPSNVQTDAKLTPSANPGFGSFGDKSWDAVWQSKTRMTEDGWMAELRIPYISLRFAKKDLQTWGLQFLRFTRLNNESAYWNAVNPNIDGFANQFGKYTDLEQIAPPLRLSFSPYISGGIRNNPEGSRIKREYLRSGGMDVKWGLNEAFTLDATLIPDFGQVISDNVINNLSPFEIQFKENRPFFTEGIELFNKAGLFYSRRVGATPGGYNGVERFLDTHPDFELRKNPQVTQLYNAIKFSGRNKNKLGIGIFNAVTAQMNAVVRNINSKEDSVIQTEPLTNYNIIVLDQGLKGRSSITFTNTNVMRQGEARDANVTAFDWSLFFDQNKYRFSGTTRYSHIFGTTPFSSSNINLMNDTVRQNGSLVFRPYDGYNTTVRFGKVSGTIQYYIQNNITSNTYNPNDLGFLQVANQVNYNGGISYNQFKPTGPFVQYRYRLDVTSRWLYRPYRYNEMNVAASAFWWFKNFWDVTVRVSSFPTTQYDYFELRTPGKVLARPAEATFEVNGSSDSRKKLYFGWRLAYAPRAKANNDYNRQEFTVRYRFNDRFTLSLETFRQYENNQIGWAFIREANRDPIIGYRHFTEHSNILSGIYNFTPRLNVTLRTRHYWNKLQYNSFYNVADDGSHIPRAFVPGQDGNYNLFNTDAFLTWDFGWGNRLILGWKNWIGDRQATQIDGARHRDYLSNLGQLWSVPHGNEFTLRIIYFLDYNTLRRKR